MQFVIGAFLTLTMISSCDTFRDEITPDSYSETIKHVDGNWRLFTVSRNGIDITEYMDFSRFHIVLNKDNTYEIKNNLPFILETIEMQISDFGRLFTSKATYPLPQPMLK